MRSPAQASTRQQRERLSEATLWELMETTRYLHCSLARDKVFAVMGLTTLGCAHVKVDYDVPLQEIVSTALRGHHLVRPPVDLEQLEHQAGVLYELGGEAPLPGRSPGRLGHLEILAWARYYGYDEAVKSIAGN